MGQTDQCSHCGGPMQLLRTQMMTTKTGRFRLEIHACSKCHLLDLRPDPEITIVRDAAE